MSTAELAVARAAWVEARDARRTAEHDFAHDDRVEDEAWAAYDAVSPELPEAREAYRKGQAARNERLCSCERLDQAERAEEDAEHEYLRVCAAAGCQPDW
jgi:hypothetical protein